jgi:protein SCO1
MEKRAWLGALLLLALLGWSGCSEQRSSSSSTSTNSMRTFEVKGVLQRIEEDGKTAVIKHEAIPNYMQAMTMPLTAKNTNELEGLKPGDELAFKMVVTEVDGWIENIRKTGATNAVGAPETRSFRRVREVEPLAEGDVMPNYTFTNELGKAVSLYDYKGSAIAFTFIFTRCPFPTFCPRMSGNFAEAAKRLASEPGVKNWKMFSISFDPEFDTPQVLKNYASRYERDPEKWSFVTGKMIDIDAITEQFGLGFAFRQGTIDHNLRTVIVDAAGKVQKIYIGNEWKVDEFVEEMKKAAAAKGPESTKQ